MSVRWMLYRAVMRLAHRFHWHYAPPIFPDGDTLLWCKWCGLRYVEHRLDTPLPPKAAQPSPRTQASSGADALPESERHTNPTKESSRGVGGGGAGEPRGGEPQ